jgi:hypothetical protein
LKARGMKCSRCHIGEIKEDSQSAAPNPVGGLSTGHTPMIISTTCVAGPLKRFRISRMAARKSTRRLSGNLSFSRVKDHVFNPFEVNVNQFWFQSPINWVLHFERAPLREATPRPD